MFGPPPKQDDGPTCGDDYNAALEMRTTAGPSSVLQWVLSGGTVHRLIACAARPGGVSAAVTETGLIADEDLAGAQRVTVGASRRRVGDPLPGRGLYQLAQHTNQPKTAAASPASSKHRRVRRAMVVTLLSRR
jgi:hypothetical protein